MKKLYGKHNAPRLRALVAILVCMLGASAAATAMADDDHPSASTAGDLNAVVQPAGQILDYLNIAASTFHGRDSSTAYVLTNSGCIGKTGGSDGVVTHKVILPEGSDVQFVRLYYYDTAVSSIAAYFTSYDGAGNFDERYVGASINEVGGYGSILSTPLNFTVNSFTSSINIAVNLGTENNAGTLRFCGVRIAYYPPITDRIFANGFDFVPL